MHSDETKISAGAVFAKFVLPTIWLGFGLCWVIGVGFYRGIGKGPPTPPPQPISAGIALIFIVFGLVKWIIPYHFPLKEVWLEERCVRLSNYRMEIVVPYEAIDRITQKIDVNMRYVVVDLDQETSFGRRFTFLPRNPKRPWPFSRRGEDAVVIDLRERVEAARAGKKPGGPVGSPARSIMADDELDSPI